MDATRLTAVRGEGAANVTVKSLKSHVAPARRREKGSLTPSLSGPLVLPPIVDAPGPASKPAPVPGNSGAIALGSSLGSTAPASGVVMDPRQRNCVEILTAGFVQAYVDFFFLTHRTDPNPELALIGQADKEIEVSEADMAFLREKLCAAEAARRLGDSRRVYQCFNAVSEYYLGSGDFKTAVYFLERCLDIGKGSGDVTQEMGANHGLGLAYERLGDNGVATGFHEKHLTLARGAGNLLEENIACKELVKVYRAKAMELEAAKDFEGASHLHRRCLDCAKECADRKAEGQANYHVGRTLVLLNQAEKAVPFLKNYLEISKEGGGGKEGESSDEDTGKAYSALAAAYTKQGDGARAVEALEKFLRIAQDSENVPQQAEAAGNLGVVHLNSGNFPEAVKFFEQAYELSRTMLAGGQGTREGVDRARVSLGVAKGMGKMGAFMNLLTYDMSSLLQWKSGRVSFESQAFTLTRSAK